MPVNNARDGIDHGVHGRYVGSRHVCLPCRDSGAGQGFRRGTPVKSPCGVAFLLQVAGKKSASSCLLLESGSQ